MDNGRWTTGDYAEEVPERRRQGVRSLRPERIPSGAGPCRVLGMSESFRFLPVPVPVINGRLSFGHKQEWEFV